MVDDHDNHTLGSRLRLPGVFLFSAFLTSIPLAPVAHAGAWLQPQGHGLVISQTTIARSNTLIDHDGKRRTQPNYDQWIEGLYGEYGISDAWTLGASANYTHAWQTANAGVSQMEASSITEPTLFVRRQLWAARGWQWSAQTNWQTPRHALIENGMGTGNPYAETTLASQIGYGSNWRSMNWYLDMMLGYRLRDGAPRDQWITQLTAGITPIAHWHAMLQGFGTMRAQRTSAASAFTQTATDDYDQWRVQPSIVWDVNDAWSLQVGAFLDVGGRNIGLSQGALVGVWRRF